LRDLSGGQSLSHLKDQSAARAPIRSTRLKQEGKKSQRGRICPPWPPQNSLFPPPEEPTLERPAGAHGGARLGSRRFPLSLRHPRDRRLPQPVLLPIPGVGRDLGLPGRDRPVRRP